MDGKILSILILIALILSACGVITPTPDTSANMPNPASVFCEQNGGSLQIRQTSEGEAGICVFPDGSFCDEWAFFRKECQTGQPTPTVPSAIATMQPAGEEIQWKTYQNEQLGYQFAYPTEATLESTSDPLKALVIQGESGWPAIYINHPIDRVEYRPSEGADLQAWLKEHFLISADPLDTVQIAGTTALHFRMPRSPQSYADDRYFFTHAGQLYQIVIQHTEDKEDWQLYSRFLESFRFTDL